MSMTKEKKADAILEAVAQLRTLVLDVDATNREKNRMYAELRGTCHALVLQLPTAMNPGWQPATLAFVADKFLNQGLELQPNEVLDFIAKVAVDFEGVPQRRRIILPGSE